MLVLVCIYIYIKSNQSIWFRVATNKFLTFNKRNETHTKLEKYRKENSKQAFTHTHAFIKLNCFYICYNIIEREREREREREQI